MAPKKTPTVNRGRPKTGKRAIQVLLTEREMKDLDALAETECRSRTGQATWLVVSVLRRIASGGEG